MQCSYLRFKWTTNWTILPFQNDDDDEEEEEDDEHITVLVLVL